MKIVLSKKKDNKNVKRIKRIHVYKCYASTYNGDILDSFHSELQLKNTQSAIKNNLKYLLSKLRRLKPVTTLVTEFKNIESDDATKYSTFYSKSKAETIIN